LNNNPPGNTSVAGAGILLPEKFKIMRTQFIFFAAVLLGISTVSGAQNKNLSYNIKRNGDVVGAIQVAQVVSGNRTTLKLESEVKTKFIFTFTARANEETIYDNGVMTWSSIYRKMNGNVKADKKTKANGNSYVVYKGSKTETLNNYPIRYNMLSVYVLEPVGISRVYSDNFQQYVDIQQLAEHHYKIKFPDGNWNEYFYANGVCAKIFIHHSMYSATIELKS
jgi:hypothetical protein